MARAAVTAGLSRWSVRAVLALPLLASCAAPPADPVSDWTDPPWSDASTDFAAGRSLLDGFDAPAEDVSLQRGDRALLGLQIVDGGGPTTWLVHVLVVEPRGADRGDGARLRVTVLDGDAHELSTDDVVVTRYLSDGVAAACRAAARRAPHDGPGFLGGPPSDLARGTFSLMDLVRVVEHTDALADLLWQVATGPSVFSLLGGVRLSAGISFEHATDAPNPIGADPAFAFPFRIELNGEDALLCTVVATEPKSPLRVCGGLLELRGHAPDDPDRRILLRLLAARRAGA